MTKDDKTIQNDLENFEKYNKNLYELDSNSILKIKIEAITVKAEGNDARTAYSNAFENMKKEAYRKFNNFIIHLEPLDVIKVEDEMGQKTKRIMGMLPHKKIKHNVELKIIVKVKYIEEI